MELSPASDQDATPRSSRRKSGRVSKQPAILDPSGTTSRTKRKRTSAVNEEEDDDDDDANNVASAEDEVEVEEEEESSEGEPDEEELRETRRKAKRKATPKGKPATKRAKTTANTINVPIRPAAKRARKPAAKSNLLVNTAAAEVGGLYGEIFSNQDTLESIAGEWLGKFEEHESNALTEVVNLVLRCTGCEIEVTSVDIEDPDNCTNRLSEIQEKFQAKAPSDYPLNSKARSAGDFKSSLKGFFRILYLTVASTNTLYREPLLNENIQVWISTLSGAPSRPFRHTATVVALTITSALCEIANGLALKRAITLRQLEGEGKNQRPNKGRIADWKKEADAASEKITQLETMIQDWFDTVFVHRYRDIDPKIRLDCIADLGDWIMTFPDKFFDSQHLRYLGWVLSDSASGTRLEGIKQLQRFFKDNSKLGGLGQFIERFRSRIVEIAGRDHEITARIAALELLNTLRAKGILEPNDIDTIGKLIFDSEARVRKVVVDFFTVSVEETFESKIEDLGGLEALDDALPVETDDDVSSPRLAWLRMKSLAELLQSYDSDEDITTPLPHTTGDLHDVYSTVNTESRLSLAAQSLIEKIPDLKDWDVLAGYLLFDHSSTANDGTTEDLVLQLQQAYKLDDKEEIILLDVLNASVKACLAEVAESAVGSKIKRTKVQLRELHEKQEEAAQKLAATIPKLLKKFGASPESAMAVLRLERVLNLDVFEQLRQDSTIYSILLDDINKQFLTHENQSVLAEARTALLHAKSFDELEEITDSKLAVLWEDTTHALATLSRGEDMSARGTMHPSALAILASTVLRISNLASICDCTEPLEAERRPPADQPRRKQRANAEAVIPIDAIIASVGRGIPVAGLETERVALEDMLTLKACESATFYFLWSVRNIQSGTVANNDSNYTTLAERKLAFTSQLRDVIKHRRGADEVRIAAAGALLELHVLFTTLRGTEGTEELVVPVDNPTQAQILRVFAATETDFARKTGKAVNSSSADVIDEDDNDDDNGAEGAEREGPTQEDRERISMSPASSIASDDVDEEAAETDETAESTARRKQHAALILEQRLCDFTAKCVLAIVAGVVDSGEANCSGKTRKSKKGAAANGGGVGKLAKRLTRNAGKLGANFKMVVGALHTGGAVAKGKRKAKAATAAAGKVAKSKELVDSDDDDGDAGEDEIVDEDEVGEDERLQQQQVVREEGDTIRLVGGSDAGADQDSMMGD